MNFNLNMEIGKKKDIYPSKKSINLYYQDDVSTKVSSMMLKVLFVAVVVLALAKFFVVDVITERNEAKAQLEEIQSTLDDYMLALQDYDAVAEEYALYSYKVLVDALETQDRLEILAMLEDTVFKNGGMSNFSINGNLVSLTFSGLNLDECAQLIAEIQAYEMVESVLISNQTGNEDGTYQGNLSITLKAKNAEATAGGEQ